MNRREFDRLSIQYGIFFVFILGIFLIMFKLFLFLY